MFLFTFTTENLTYAIYNFVKHKDKQGNSASIMYIFNCNYSNRKKYANMLDKNILLFNYSIFKQYSVRRGG